MYNIFETDICDIPSKIPNERKRIIGTYATRKEAYEKLDSILEKIGRDEYVRYIGTEDNYVVDYGSWSDFYGQEYIEK